MFVPGGPGATPAGGAPMAPAGAGPSKRSSAVLQPMAGGMGLVDFDSDYESDEDQPPQKVAPPAQPVTGSAVARPMVGGFAAAAYEAAKADHYARLQAQKAKKAGGAPSQRRSHK